MNELQIFNNELFGEIRFVEVDGKPYAVANDIAKALGYKNPTDAVNTKCMNIVKHEVENSRGEMRTISDPKNCRVRCKQKKIIGDGEIWI